MFQKGFSKITILIICNVALILTFILVWQYWQAGKTTTIPSLVVFPNQEGGDKDELSNTFSISREITGPKAKKANGRPPLEVLKNMEYQLFECPTSSDNYSDRYYYLRDKGICMVKLENGEYDFYEKISERPGFYESGFVVSFSEAAFADLNNDNVDDALVTLRVYGGGTGSTIYLAIVMIKGDEYYNTDTVAIPCDGVTDCFNPSFSVDKETITVYIQGEACYILLLRFSETEGLKVIEKKYLDYPCGFRRDFPSPRDRF